MFRKVLIPSDGSQLSKKAVKAGIALAKDMNAHVIGYSAYERITPHVEIGESDIVSPKLSKAFEQCSREIALKHVNGIGEQARRAGVPFELGVSKVKDVADGIIDVAKKEGCDAIFMGSQSGGRLRNFLLGSVTQKVLARARIPVLVFR